MAIPMKKMISKKMRCRGIIGILKDKQVRNKESK